MRSILRLRGRAPAPMWFTSAFYSVFASLSFFLTIWENGDQLADHLKATLTVRKEFETYDFIIVGGGTAGSVLAHRLSENPAWKVLLIEAGGEPHPLQSIPIAAYSLARYPQIDWSHKILPQKKAFLATEGRAPNWTAGRSLGGSSNINYLIYLRGHPRDFDNWADVTGDPSWKYENVVEYFKKSEDYSGEWVSDGLHGFGGPIHIQKPDYTGLAAQYVRAGQDMGYSHVDLNGNYTEGFDTIYYPLKNGRRQATYKAFIQTARTRPNLIIYKYAHVNRILFRNESTQAYGVQYDRYGVKRFAYARKEIILSAGTVQSPKLLMLSGIGPKQQLEDLKIPVVLDSPGVGKNLQDHVGALVGPFEIDSHEVPVLNMDRDISPGAFYEYSTRGQGVLTTSTCQATGVLTSSVAKRDSEPGWPDSQLTLFGLSVHKTLAKDLARTLGWNTDLLSQYYSESIGKSSFQQAVAVVRPKSRGEITLERNDPYAAPVIDPKYFDNEDDMKILVEGIKRAVFLAENTTTFSTLGTALRSVAPGCEDVPFKSDEYYECYAKIFTTVYYHGVGSCSMGRNDSRTAVVDPELKVIGVQGLRVIDASVMPFVPASNTMAPTIMIAERGADLIKSAWMEPEQEEATTTATSPSVDPFPVITANETNQSNGTDSKIVSASSNSVLTDCDYCELDGRKDQPDLQFAL